jgi:hypothetical protein
VDSLFVGPQVVELSVSLVASRLSALERLKFEIHMCSLDVKGQGLALGERFCATFNNTMERLQLDDRRVSCALMRLEVV